MQNGFREEHSTQRAIIYIVNTIQTNGQTAIFVWCLYRPKTNLSIVQSFDHTIFPGMMNNCFSYYPQDRTRTAQIGPHISERTVSLCGVPQGSALGPLLFFIH